MIRNLENSEKNRRKQEVLGIFFFERGGVTYSQKYMSEKLLKSEHFDEDQKCSKGPKMQNKPYFFFLETGVPKRGGGPTLGKYSQKIPFFLGGGVPKKVKVREFCYYKDGFGHILTALLSD